MLAARVLAAVTAHSVAAVEDRVTLPQLRVLVLLASRGSATMGAVARGLGVHPSNTTRTCDRLVGSGLLRRRDDPADRRTLVLELTPAGRRLVDGVDARRRDTIAELLAGLPAHARSTLVSALGVFATVDDTAADPAGAWSLGWITEQPTGTLGAGASAHRQASATSGEIRGLPEATHSISRAPGNGPVGMKRA